MKTTEPESQTIQVNGLSTSFDLTISCSSLSAASLATELLLRAAALPDFRVERSGEDLSSNIRFMVAYISGRTAYAAELFLDGDELLAAYISSPSEWSASKRATACSIGLAPLFSAVRAPDGSHPIISPANQLERND